MADTGNASARDVLRAEIAQLRAEREACNLDIEDRRVKTRKLSERIVAAENELAALKN